VVLRDSAAGLLLYERESYYPRAYWKSQLGMKGADIERVNSGNITETEYSDNYQKFEINCISRDTLVLAENYYPGWNCYDNLKRVRIFSASLGDFPTLFRLVSLAPGRHVIEFKYHKVFGLF
jgi:hypothetical protein